MRFLKIAVVSTILLFLPFLGFAQDGGATVEEKISAEVLKVIDETESNEGGENAITQILEVRLDKTAERVQAENNNNHAPGMRKYVSGDKVYLVTQNVDGQVLYETYDYNRIGVLFWLTLFFVVIAIVIGRKQGFSSLVGMVLSFLLIFYFVLPQISAGQDAFTMSIIAALIIVPASFYLSHGFNRKATAAIISTMVTLILIGLLAGLVVGLSHLTGADSEEVNFLLLDGAAIIDVKQLLMAGIIISLLGVLDDITISQSAIVYKLKEVSPDLKMSELISKAMDIGRDHIASVINTLVLVYAGAALPLLLLFLRNPAPIAEILNEEFMAKEIIKTLVASIGIIVAVPLTTFISAVMVGRGRK